MAMTSEDREVRSVFLYACLIYLIEKKKKDLAYQEESTYLMGNKNILNDAEAQRKTKAVWKQHALHLYYLVNSMSYCQRSSTSIKSKFH